MRKLSIISGMLSVALALWHMVTMSFALIEKNIDIHQTDIMATLLMITLLVHILSNIIRKIKIGRPTYLKFNVIYLLQQVTGIGILVVYFFHYVAYKYTDSNGQVLLRNPTIAIYIGEVVFTICIVFHLLMGLESFSISAGIPISKKGRKYIGIVNVVICMCILLGVLYAQKIYF